MRRNRLSRAFFQYGLFFCRLIYYIRLPAIPYQSKQMIRILLAAMLALNAFLANAQEKRWFDDSFDTNTKGWYYADFENENIKREIRDGKLRIHQKTADLRFWTFTSFFVDATRPFQVEANVVQQEAENGSFGIIIFGKQNKGYYFMINANVKKLYVGSELNGTWVNSSPPDGGDIWGKAEMINGPGQNNNLKIQWKNGKITFLINDQQAFSGSGLADFAEFPFVNFVGVITQSPGKYEVDHFTFFQDNPDINLVPNLPRLARNSLGAGVNSKYTEKQPYISPDGKTLYFVVSDDPANKGSDDIYFTSAITDSTWAQRQQMAEPLNNVWPNAVLTATPDNNTLFLMHTYNTDGTPKGAGFSVSHKTLEGWSMPEDIKVDNYYNTGQYNEFCFSPDRKILISGVTRDDTHGMNDLYVSFLKDDGTYTEPKNLGSTVNTFSQESSPFLAADGITMYYSTAGLPGYGNADIFMTRRLDSTWVNWSPPQNMGPDLNSAGWEAYYSVAASGRYAFVISTDNTIENSPDLFSVKLPQALRPRPVVLVYGKVLNSKTKTALQARINYNILSTNKEVGLASSAPADGTYKIALPAGEAYSFLASREGFYPVSENMDLSKITEYKEIERDLYLAPLEVGEIIRLNNLFFDFNKSVLRNESVAELERVVKLLAGNPTMSIEIAGHTDSVGDDAVNNKLSLDRATSVKLYLQKQGITPTRIVARGYGKTKPVAVNTTDDGRQKNRRVEFVIVSK
jgi:outer membrane protein OmpA-like peptidoglycan-associated protein